MGYLSTWRKMISSTLKENGEDWNDIVSVTLTDDELDVEFDRSYGSIHGQPFTAWSENYVYFPLCHAGSERVGSVPRNPNGQATDHQGG